MPRNSNVGYKCLEILQLVMVALLRYNMGWLNCCQCNSKEEKVTELDFSRCGILEVPNEVYTNSPTLEVLHLEGNKLKDLSPQLFQCIDLRYLNVSDNEIQTIPPLISKLANLQVLVFSKNVLEGVHPNLDKLSKLTILDLSMNDLGKVPDVIMSLINLQQLCLNDTGIDFIPANIGRLSNLRILELRDNHLCELPKSIRRLTNLQRLDVSDNNLDSLIQVCQPQGNLTELWINGNNISKLSVSITHLKEINDFDASYNNLVSVPNEIGHWTKITNLILSFNSLTSLPRSIGNLTNLEVLKLESNFLSELPETICGLVNLEELNLQNNSLNKLPGGIGHLRKLSTLILSDNKLKLLVPEVGRCHQLSILNIHNNLLERLPEEIGNLQNLTTLGLIGNRLSYLPLTISKLASLKALWLSPNQTQPLIHLQNEQLLDGHVALTSVVFPQTPLKKSSRISSPLQQQPGSHISFKTEKTEPEDTQSKTVSLNRTPTPHQKELRRLKDILKKNYTSVNQRPNVSHVKEAKVTNIPGDNHPSENSINEYQLKTLDVQGRAEGLNEGNIPKHPPPYHIAAAYSKNAHLFLHGSPSPYAEPKQFSQQQPLNIPTPTPKMAISLSNIEKSVSFILDEDDSKRRNWPFGNSMCQILELDLPEHHQTDFQLIAKDDGIFVEDVNLHGPIFRRLFIGDKVLAFDETKYNVMSPIEAYRDACSKLETVRVVTIARAQ